MTREAEQQEVLKLAKRMKAVKTHTWAAYTAGMWSTAIRMLHSYVGMMAASDDYMRQAVADAITVQQAESAIATLTAENERLKGENAACEVEIAALRKVARVGTELDNHHAASYCPYCNPDRVMFPRDLEITRIISETKTILAEKDAELATLKGRWAWLKHCAIERGLVATLAEMKRLEQPVAPAPREEAK